MEEEKKICPLCEKEIKHYECRWIDKETGETFHKRCTVAKNADIEIKKD